jgi:hypothetical protein
VFESLFHRRWLREVRLWHRRRGRLVRYRVWPLRAGARLV